MKFYLESSLIAVSLFLSVACTTAPLNDFTKVKKGMTKDDVLDLLGSPSRTERIDGKEKWAYRYWTGEDHSIETLRQVTFLNSNVVAFGEDVEEEQRLREIQQEDAAREERRAKLLNSAVIGAPPENHASVLPQASPSPSAEEAGQRPAIEEDFVEVKGSTKQAPATEGPAPVEANPAPNSNTP